MRLLLILAVFLLVTSNLSARNPSTDGAGRKINAENLDNLASAVLRIEYNNPLASVPFEIVATGTPVFRVYPEGHMQLLGMTSTARDRVGSDGMIVFNKESNSYQFYRNAAYEDIKPLESTSADLILTNQGNPAAADEFYLLTPRKESTIQRINAKVVTAANGGPLVFQIEKQNGLGGSWVSIKTIGDFSIPAGTASLSYQMSEVASTSLTGETLPAGTNLRLRIVTDDVDDVARNLLITLESQWGSK